MEKDTTKGLSKVIRIDESEIRGHLDKMVKGTVEDTLNALLEAEADEMCNAHRNDLTTVGTSGLVLVKGVDKPTAQPGEVLTYTITYSNMAS